MPRACHGGPSPIVLLLFPTSSWYCFILSCWMPRLAHCLAGTEVPRRNWIPWLWHKVLINLLENCLPLFVITTRGIPKQQTIWSLRNFLTSTSRILVRGTASILTEKSNNPEMTAFFGLGLVVWGLQAQLYGFIDLSVLWCYQNNTDTRSAFIRRASNEQSLPRTLSKQVLEVDPNVWFYREIRQEVASAWPFSSWFVSNVELA